MTLLIIGLLLWVLSHTLKRIAPGLRAALGENRGKGLVSLLSLAGIVLMVIGYRGAETVPLYAPLPGTGHLNNLLMLVSLFFFGVGGMKPGVVATKVRHNMLTGVLIWAVAHLLVNGDLASVVLFGGMTAYALMSMALISRAVPWQRPARGPAMNDVKAAVGAVVLYAIISGIHIWLGHNPFQGTYS
ncbi:NnrU family protein [Sinisalibacter aestuarii]|uniref:Membrane protein n=1 Tax=Sinisalibacter aestuarii TaxID=2949426 RepID=A0ABQ5LN05_9RHOB|nr:NnrU family protein [Sinisalibacter aestuarii]GKY86158.1 membrane protein [Sinisalibacter aestuarii]